MIGPIWAVISFYLRAPWLLLLLRSIESWADLSLHLHTTYQVGWWVLGRGHSLLFLWGKQFFDIKSSLLPKLGKFNFFFFCQKLSKKEETKRERLFSSFFNSHSNEFRQVKTVSRLQCKFNGPNPASFSFIFALFKQTLRFLQQMNVKNVQMSIQYTAPGSEPTTFWTWVVTHNH